MNVFKTIAIKHEIETLQNFYFAPSIVLPFTSFIPVLKKTNKKANKFSELKHYQLVQLNAQLTIMCDFVFWKDLIKQK